MRTHNSQWPKNSSELLHLKTQGEKVHLHRHFNLKNPISNSKVIALLLRRSCGGLEAGKAFPRKSHLRERELGGE